jgi:hypothetical protein
MGINRKFFFNHTREVLFSGTLTQGQVNGLTAILDFWEAHHAAKDDRWLAYALGTAHHETDRKIQPIKEYGNDAYFTRRYDPPPAGQNPSVAHQLGNNQPGDGAKYCGRGFVQLTGRRNYADWGNRLGIPLVANPALAMQADVATKILIEGSRLGTFTGKKFADYFNPAKEDWVNARRIINGLDKANLIASYAKSYYSAISYTV